MLAGYIGADARHRLNGYRHAELLLGLVVKLTNRVFRESGGGSMNLGSELKQLIINGPLG
jgi:hypothetical protein